MLVSLTRGTQDAVANGDTRTLEITQMHTGERVSVTFRRNGRYDRRGLEQLNWVMRDWRRDEATEMDPRLYDLLWEVHRSTGSRQPVHVVSAYRAPQTNEALRRRSRNVAKQSQHTVGKAVDFYLPDVPAERIRTLGLRMQRGGVGYYPRANTPFVHLDTGSVRHWPRMNRRQLVNVFPDQRTVHIPTDGKPLAGFDQARSEILAAGGNRDGRDRNGDRKPGTAGGAASGRVCSAVARTAIRIWPKHRRSAKAAGGQSRLAGRAPATGVQRRWSLRVRRARKRPPRDLSHGRLRLHQSKSPCPRS